MPARRTPFPPPPRQNQIDGAGWDCSRCERPVRWHQGKHDAWPTLNFLLFTLTQACKEFEQRLGQVKSPRGEKTAIIEDAIARQAGLFSLSDLQRACPGVSVDLIRTVLKRLKGSKVECLGRGHTAQWRKTGIR